MIKEKIIKLKSQPKWVARSMFGIWTVLWLWLAVHMLPIGWSKADNEIVPNTYVHEAMVGEINTLTICDPNDGTACITVMDRNLWAETNDITSTWSYWYHYQWWNNHWFLSCYEEWCTDFPWWESTTDEQVDATLYWPWNWFNSWIWFNGEDDWSNPSNDNLWWWWDDEINDYEYPISNYDERQWPCETWYHVPSASEWSKLLTYWVANYTWIWNELQIDSYNNLIFLTSEENPLYDSDNSFENVQVAINQIMYDLKLPFGGWRSMVDAWVYSDNALWSSSPNSDTSFAMNFWYSDDEEFEWIYADSDNSRAFAYPIRCFKNTALTFSHVEFFDDGESISSWTVASWSTAESIRPSDPEKDGFTFDWWYETGATEPFDFDTPIIEDLNLYAKWLDNPPTCDVTYNPGSGTTTAGNVIATLTGCSESVTVTNNSGSIRYTFENTWNFTFQFKDAGNNTWSAVATVTWIDKNKPTCDVKYSTTWWTNTTVTATLTGCSKTWITVLRPNGSWTYPFTRSWTFTFEFRDATGNTGSTTASVYWIDKDKPSCSVFYETQWESWHESTTARLTGCSENITVTNTSGNAIFYILWYSGTFTFQFKDRANNTWKATASYNMPKNTIQVNNSREMMYLFTWNWAISCEYNYNSWNYSQKFVIYIKTWAAYANLDMSGTTLTYGSELFINDKIYQWWSFYSSLGSWEWVYTNYDFNITEVIHSLFGSSSGGTVFMCYTWIDDNSVFDLPDNITFYNQNHYAATHDIYFSVIVDDSIKAWEYNNFTVKVVKNGQRLRDYNGRVYFELVDEDWDPVDDDDYVIRNRKYYDFDESDNWRKTFTDWLKINKAWTYTLRVYDRDDYEWSETIVVRWRGSMPSDFEYDTWKFDSGYSTEMNMAYQFARYYDITTINSIKDAKMKSWLNRIAMAKMLANYAENVLWIDDFDTSRNCSFSDVSSSLDKDYDYWVTKACQLWIMWVNMKSGKFYPKWWVTRAEFATALSRLLYNTSDWTDKYYSTHIYKLYREWIITNTDPDLREKRWYVMLMLMRASEKYDY